jgi:hypothetical protein
LLPVSDRAPAMTGKNNGIAAKLKNKMKEFHGTNSSLCLHCIHYQQALCLKSFKMNQVTDNVKKMRILFMLAPLTIVKL